jgi:UDP-N-acetylbacillosamine N-acetyltransferase
MQKLIIFGTGTLAKLLHHYIVTTTDDLVVGFTVDALHHDACVFDRKPVYEYESIDNSVDTSDIRFISAVGYASMRSRRSVFQRLKADGRQLYSYISPSAVIDSSAILGENSIIFPLVVVEPFCQLGDNNILWSGSTVCHDANIGSHNFIAANATLGGFISMGNCCFIGFNAVAVQHLSIADETLVGASALLLQSTDAATRYLGSPAKAVATHEDTGIVI